jgi:OmpA-OmpF porin, OOP family
MRASIFARLTAFGMAGLAALLFLSAAQAAGPAPKGKTYGKVYLPTGDVSFADAVVSFVPGNPKPYPELSRPETALGPPDYTNPSNTDAQDRAHPTFVTLGCGGVLTLKFTDNAIVDVPGPDIWVFEIGGAVEPE